MSDGEVVLALVLAAIIGGFATFVIFHLAMGMALPVPLGWVIL